jgi:hypothetical protein
MKTTYDQRSVSAGIKVKSNIKAGVLGINHNQIVARGLRVKSGVKAGGKSIAFEGGPTKP